MPHGRGFDMSRGAEDLSRVCCSNEPESLKMDSFDGTVDK